MLAATRCRVRRAQDPVVAGEARAGVPATTRTPTGRSNEERTRPTEPDLLAGWWWSICPRRSRHPKLVWMMDNLPVPFRVRLGPMRWTAPPGRCAE